MRVVSKRMATGIMLGVIVTTLSGCSMLGRTLISMGEEDVMTGKSSVNRQATSRSGVKPWQKGKLSRREMLWNPDPLGISASKHFSGTREGVLGGTCTGTGSFGCQ